jgi:hypothetical protein
MNNSNLTLGQDDSTQADETEKESSPPSLSVVEQSDSAPPEASPRENEEWLRLGIEGQERLALLRSTVSSIRWQSHPHQLRLTTQLDGIVVADLSALESASGESLWRDLLAGKIDNINAPPYEVLVDA